MVVEAVTQGLDDLAKLALFIQLAGLNEAFLATVNLPPSSQLSQQQAAAEHCSKPKGTALPIA
jgi:hypothetical protein